MTWPCNVLHYFGSLLFSVSQVVNDELSSMFTFSTSHISFEALSLYLFLLSRDLSNHTHRMANSSPPNQTVGTFCTNEIDNYHFNTISFTKLWVDKPSQSEYLLILCVTLITIIIYCITSCDSVTGADNGVGALFTGFIAETSAVVVVTIIYICWKVNANRFLIYFVIKLNCPETVLFYIFKQAYHLYLML